MATKYKRGPDGAYKARVWDGTYKGGMKHYTYLRSRKSSRDLERKVEEYRASVRERKQIRKTDVLFLDYASEWLSVYKADREANTIRMYERVIKAHMRSLEGVRLDAIERIHIQELLNGANGHPATQRQILLTVKQVLRSAVTDHLFPANVYTDIFSAISPVKYKPQERRGLTEAERRAVFDADLSDSDRAFLFLLYGCGLRREEALALTIFDVKDQAVSVSKAHALLDDGVQKKGPKTEHGYRTVPIPDLLYPAIARHLETVKHSGGTYLFTMKNGKPVSKSSYIKMWRRIVTAMQAVCPEPIEGLTAHIFRHNYCTSLCYQIPAISLKHIARLMGDTEAVAMKTYNHIMMEKEDAASVVNQALSL